jgi:hypothetical protein
MKNVYALRVVRSSPNALDLAMWRVGSYLLLIAGDFYPVVSVDGATIYDSRAAANNAEREGSIPEHVQVEVVPFIEKPAFPLRRRKRA